MADKQSLIVRLKFQKHDITADGKLTRKSRIVILKYKSPSPVLSSDISSSESEAPISRKRPATNQQGRMNKRAKLSELEDIEETVEDGGSDATPHDAAEDYLSNLTSLCRTGQSDDELMLLPADQIRGVILLQLRLTRNITTLINDYNVLHDVELRQTTVKRAFSNAFNDIAQHNGVPVDDLKDAYNSISTASKARKSGARFEVEVAREVVVASASEPADVGETTGLRRSSRASSRARDATPTVQPIASKKVVSKKAAPQKSASKKPATKKAPKQEIIGAQEGHPYIAIEKFEGEIEIDERFQEWADKGADLPRLPFNHPLYETLNERRDFETLTTDQLREIDHVRRLHTTDEIAMSINAMMPGCTTRADVKVLVEKVREALVLPGGQDNSYDEETDSYLPKDELLSRRAPRGPHGYNGRMWN